MQATDTFAVREELNRILASPVFAKSPRMSRFLKFVVEETIEGRSERIKEYVIALEVFGKDEKYDSQTDSTVRTEASKLRSRLGRYYESEGRDDGVLISIPKGACGRCCDCLEHCLALRFRKERHPGSCPVRERSADRRATHCAR
jgi:hypothetical protein